MHLSLHILGNLLEKIFLFVYASRERLKPIWTELWDCLHRLAGPRPVFSAFLHPWGFLQTCDSLQSMQLFCTLLSIHGCCRCSPSSCFYQHLLIFVTVSVWNTTLVNKELTPRLTNKLMFHLVHLEHLKRKSACSVRPSITLHVYHFEENTKQSLFQVENTIGDASTFSLSCLIDTPRVH